MSRSKPEFDWWNGLLPIRKKKKSGLPTLEKTWQFDVKRGPIVSIPNPGGDYGCTTFKIKHDQSGTGLTITASDKMPKDAALLLSKFKSILLKSDGSAWHVVEDEDLGDCAKDTNGNTDPKSDP
jgi:hypothetical protein